jgi:HEAT repeat protein
MPDSKSILPDLKIAIQDDDKFVRCQILQLLGRMGKGSSELVPDIILRLKEDQVIEVRLAAIEALAALGDKSKEIIDALTIASRNNQAAIRDAAKEALSKLEGDSQ